jgi:hypothetical protein
MGGGSASGRRVTGGWRVSGGVDPLVWVDIGLLAGRGSRGIEDWDSQARSQTGRARGRRTVVINSRLHSEVIGRVGSRAKYGVAVCDSACTSDRKPGVTVTAVFGCCEVFLGSSSSRVPVVNTICFGFYFSRHSCSVNNCSL